MDISVIIPLFNEEESLPELYRWIARVMDEHNFSYEVIFIDDGSTDNSWNVVKELRQADPAHVKGASFRRNYGKSPALNTGFGLAKGNVVITMDADLQDSPDEIPELYRMITQDGLDLVSGFKKKRYDPLSKTIPTKLFNATARKVSGIKNLHDFNCGLKAYRAEVVKHIEVYGDMHRYIPYLAKLAGFNKIGEKVVHHRARKYGKTKFGLDRFVNGYRFAHIMVHRTFREKAHAFFRPLGKPHVHFRPRGCDTRGCHEAIPHAFWTSLYSGNRFSIFLYIFGAHAAWLSTFPCRIRGRTGGEELAKKKRIRN